MANTTSKNKKKSGFKWIVMLILGTLYFMTYHAEHSDNYYDSYSDDSYYYDNSDEPYVADNYTSNSNDLVGVWSNSEGTIAIYETGVAEISTGNESLDYSWTASGNTITFIPFDRLSNNPATMSYYVSGNELSLTSEGITMVLYK